MTYKMETERKTDGKVNDERKTGKETGRETDLLVELIKRYSKKGICEIPEPLATCYMFFKADFEVRKLDKLTIKTFIDRYSDENLLFLLKKLKDTDLIKLEECRSFFLDPDSRFEKRKSRLKKFNKSVYQQEILSLYDKPMRDVVISDEQHDLETFILEFDSVDLEKVIKNYGIMIPANIISLFHRRYVLQESLDILKTVSRSEIPCINNLDDYRKVRRQVLLDSTLLNNLTMKEIIFITNIVFPYHNRRDYLNKFRSYKEGNQFFYRVMPDPVSSKNQETTLLTEITEPIRFLCYGNFMEYTSYEPEELVESFKVGKEMFGSDKLYFPMKPDKNDEIFSTEELTTLGNLLTSSINDEQANNLLEIVNTMIAQKIKLKEFDSYVSSFEKLSSNDRDTFANLLKGLFISGMYMRRWEGEGKPYPMSREDTENKEIPDVQVSAELMNCKRIISSMSNDLLEFYKTLPLVKFKKIEDVKMTVAYFDGGDTTTLMYILFDKICDDKYCIRMGSSKLIRFSSLFYLLFYNKTFPDLDISKLQDIQ